MQPLTAMQPIISHFIMTSLFRRLGLKLFLRSPVRSRHAEPSLLYFIEPDDPSQPTPELMELALATIHASQKIDLSDVSARIEKDIKLTAIWPGGHYKLLAGLVTVIKPKLIVEIGTATGSSALMISFLGGSTRDSILTEDNFFDGTFEQRVGDISKANEFSQHKELLADADLIFIDAAKDGYQEQLFLDNFEQIQFKFRQCPILVFDDIPLWNMLRYGVKSDIQNLITSFGHWSGTGLIQWNRTSKRICSVHAR